MLCSCQEEGWDGRGHIHCSGPSDCNAFSPALLSSFLLLLTARQRLESLSVSSLSAALSTPTSKTLRQPQLSHVPAYSPHGLCSWSQRGLYLSLIWNASQYHHVSGNCLLIQCSSIPAQYLRNCPVSASHPVEAEPQSSSWALRDQSGVP